MPVDWNWLVRHSGIHYIAAAFAAGSQSVVARVSQQINQDEGRSMIDVTGVKVFSATKAKERELLGELITDWIRSHPEHEIVDKIVTQSSDSEFHCLTITLFYKHNAKS